jgi:arsenate reductase
MPRRVLILCTANSARSQMAEGWLRHIAGTRLDVESAGAKPSVVNPLAIQVMAEQGVDIRGHASKSLDGFLGQPFDYVVTVCDNAAESCPLFPGVAERIHWSFPDPAAVEGNAAKLMAFQQVRDALYTRLATWFATLPEANP